MRQVVRLDKWLWAVRFFKTRSAAAGACNGGKIKRLGVNLKPAAMIRAGDVLEVPSFDGTHKKIIEVVEVLDKRVSALLARAAYLDKTSAEILEQAQQRKAEMRAERQVRKEGDQGRMTKKRRRDWDKDWEEG